MSSNELNSAGGTRRISCLFYTHPWVLRVFSARRLRLAESVLLVEIANRPVLATPYGLHTRLRLGVAGLLQRETTVKDLADQVEGLHHRIIFAANPAISVPAMTGGVGLLPYCAIPESEVVLLVHLSEYESFASIYPYCSRFHFMWDAADPQSYLLPEAARLLARLRLLRRDTWGGFFWYMDPHRPVADAAENLRMLGALARKQELPAAAS